MTDGPRSAFVGCGPRAKEHAKAYRRLPRGRIVAACARTRTHVDRFCQEFAISGAYTEARAMVEQERPDLVHIVTTADVRLPLIELMADLQVPVVIVEKPVALQGEDWKRLSQLVERSSTRFVVNSQLPFHPRLRDLERSVRRGDIGDVQVIDASAGSTIVDQGVHLLDLAHRFGGLVPPVSVFAQSAGVEGLASADASPDQSLLMVDFGQGVGAHVVLGSLAPRLHDAPFWAHKRIAVYGSTGFVRWSMIGWDRLVADGAYERGTLEYEVEDDIAQAALTEAAFRLLEPGALPHPTRIELALLQFNLILGSYVSSLSRSPVSLPCDPPGGLLDSLRRGLERP